MCKIVHKKLLLSAIIFLLSAFMVNASSMSIFKITLIFKPSPFHNSEWYISIVRNKDKYYIESNNPKFYRRKKILSIYDYKKIIKTLNINQLFNCRNLNHNVSPYNKYDIYLLKIQQNNYMHECEVDTTWLLNYPDKPVVKAIKSINNFAKIFLNN